MPLIIDISIVKKQRPKMIKKRKKSEELEFGSKMPFIDLVRQQLLSEYGDCKGLSREVMDGRVSKP